MIDDDIRKDLIEKYKVAGKIRLISFFLLLLFLSLMKWAGGYGYLNPVLILLILTEAIFNQPYGFIVRRVNIHRLQYYQMTVDIIAITWLLYYMGGVDAPVIGIAYYAVILWAGVVSSDHAVFFAVILSSAFMAAVVLLEHGGMLPPTVLYSDRLPTAKMLSLLIGNISYLFAFGYFSAHSSKIIKLLERKQQNESLRFAHKFSAIDHLISLTTHDILGRFNNARAWAQILLTETKQSDENSGMLKTIIEEGDKGIAMLRRLSLYSRKGKPEFEQVNINAVIDNVIDLTWPVVKYSPLTISKEFSSDLPLISAIKDQIQEVFVAVILNALDATIEKSTLTIKTEYHKEKQTVEIICSDTGVGVKREYLNQANEPYLTSKERREHLGTGLSISNEIIVRHGGNMHFKSAMGGRGTTFTVRLPVYQSPNGDVKSVRMQK